MRTLIPILIESEDIIHPLRAVDQVRMSEIQNEIYGILKDSLNTQYIPEKRLLDIKAAKDRMFGFIMGYQTGLSYAHFITDKRTSKVIGLIDVISPEKAKHTYIIDKFDWMTEYFLYKDYWGQGLMTGIVGAVCHRIKMQGIETIAAICDKNNLNSIYLLEKIGFLKTKSLNIKQDYFEL